MAELNLLPCPFCGGTPKLIGLPGDMPSSVNCTSCDAYGASVIGNKTAITAWNRRAAPAVQLDADNLPPRLSDEQIDLIAKQHSTTLRGWEWSGDIIEVNGYHEYEFARGVEQSVVAPYAERIRLLEREVEKFYERLPVLVSEGTGIITVDGRKYYSSEVRDLIEELGQAKARIDGRTAKEA